MLAGSHFRLSEATSMIVVVSLLCGSAIASLLYSALETRRSGRDVANRPNTASRPKLAEPEEDAEGGAPGASRSVPRRHPD
jgi:hypothetical protein